MVIAHGIFSGISGSLVSHTGHYNPVIISGAAVWTVAAGAKTFYNQATPDWAFVIVGAMEGFGVGFCFQPGKFYRVLFLGFVVGGSLMAGLVLVALMANSLRADRAVMTGLRNFLRAMGGAIGLTGRKFPFRFLCGLVEFQLIRCQYDNSFRCDFEQRPIF